MLSNKYAKDRSIITMATGTKMEKAARDGYYIVDICDKDNVCNNEIYISSNNNKEEGEFFPIFGKMIGGVMTELITDTILKYYDDVDFVIESKDNSNKDYGITNYHFSEPCYISAYQIYPKQLVKVLKNLDKNYDVEEYKEKILSQINEATKHYADLTKEDEKYIEEFIEKHKTKNYTRI